MTDSLGNAAQLPSSHYFVTVARGATSRTLTLKTGIVRLGLCGLALLGCWTAGSSVYLAVHDDLLASLMAQEARMQYVYEDRIAVLRSQVDREASRGLVGQSTLDARLSELTQRAASLESRAALVGQLAARAGLARPSDRAMTRSAAAAMSAPNDGIDNPVREDVTGLVPHSLPEGASWPVWHDKPHPETDAAPMDPATHAELGNPASSLNLRLAALTEVLERVDGTQYGEIASIAAAARKKTDALRAVIAEAGLSPDRFKTAPAPSSAEGGPFVPLDSSILNSPFGQALSALQVDVASAERLRDIIPHVPIESPLLGTAEITSPFGARLDPFLGRPAMHTGVDLREGYGTDVRATAEGRVVGAGAAGGYGTMIEVDHGNGLSTRYAHLSSVMVGVGQKVATGEVIGQVGATGRATGPHLHYETRIDGEPVDPMRFLQAGQRLATLGPAL